MNISSRLSDIARSNPDKKAIIFSQIKKNPTLFNYSSFSFKELDILSNKFAQQLSKLGLQKGDKAFVYLKSSLNTEAMIFALFKMGAIPVFVDHPMEIKDVLNSIKESASIALIAEKKIHLLKFIYPSFFKMIKTNITTGSFAWGKMISIKTMKKEKIQAFTSTPNNPEEPAAIIFTAESPLDLKGVVYTHSMIEKQVSIFKELYALTPNDTAMTCYPLFSLISTAIGMTNYIPDLALTNNGKYDPKKITQNILDLSPTFISGPPAILEKIADYCLENEILLPSVKSVVIFGCPVSSKLQRKFKTILPNGTSYTTYGALEALQITRASQDLILNKTSHLTEEGFGVCLGKPVPELEIKIIKITDETLLFFDTNIELERRQIGEIIVKASSVSKEYFNLPAITLQSKIFDTFNTFWHRMGDVGYIDEKGLLWFCGKKSHAVFTKTQTLFPAACEAIFNKHPAVKRSALVGIGTQGKQIAAIIIERKDGQFLAGKARSIFESELLTFSKNYEHTKNIQKIYLSKALPIDSYHSLRIDRLKLKDEIENNH